MTAVAVRVNVSSLQITRIGSNTTDERISIAFAAADDEMRHLWRSHGDDVIIVVTEGINTVWNDCSISRAVLLGHPVSI